MRMSETVVARLYLPMEMGAFARILQVIAKEFPDAVIGEPDEDGEVKIMLRGYTIETNTGSTTTGNSA